MKGIVLITVIVGVFFLSSFAESAQGGAAECTNNLNTCTTNLALCTTNLTNAQTNYGACNTNLGACQTNLGTCQTNADTSLSACQTNLATCQATVAQCNNQTTIPPSWYQKLACDSKDNCSRFEVVLDGAGVLDHETGLVWEKSPEIIEMLWSDASSYCYNKVLGGRKGWRLPTIEELLTLVDPSTANPSLPSGHPFSGNADFNFWSSTTDVINTNFARVIAMYDGSVFLKDKEACYVSFCPSMWCVRGGHGYDAY